MNKLDFMPFVIRSAFKIFVSISITVIVAHATAQTREKLRAGFEEKLSSITWQIIESDSIVYYFDDTTKIHPIRTYIAQHDLAYKFINHVFQAHLPVKLRFYVFTDKENGERLLSVPLGFSNPYAICCFSYSRQTLGHEMAHVLSYWGWDESSVEQTRLINEGLAVSFDMSTCDRYDMARAAVVRNNLKKNILKIWKNDVNESPDVIYPVGGAFMNYIYKHLTPDEYKVFVKNQTIATLKKIKGDSFDTFISDFEKKIGLDRR